MEGEDGWDSTERFEPDGSTPTEYSFTIPEKCLKVKFFTSGKDNSEVQLVTYQSSVLQALKVKQLEVQILKQPDTPVNIESGGQRVRLETSATANYNQEYTWQFKAPDADFWVNASTGNLSNYYPDAFFTVFENFRDAVFSISWVSGIGPTEFRCRCRDYYDSNATFEQIEAGTMDTTYVQKFTQIVTLIYPE